MTKHCGKCQRDLPIEDFSSNKTKRDGHSSTCKDCKAVYQREWYLKNRERHRANSKKGRATRRTAAREWVMAHLRDNPCVLCGFDDIRALEYDHLGDKTHNVCDIVQGGYVLEVVVKEVAKCRVLCANCHRIATSDDGSFYRSLANLE